MSKVIELGLNEIEIDGETQNRQDLNLETVDEYAEAMKNGDEFPPLSVYKDGSHNWLVDGFHRYFAYKQAGITRVTCEITTGTLKEAQIASLGVNTKHGLRRTNMDKRKAVARAFELLPDWSDRQIAKHCDVSRAFVADMKRRLNINNSDEPCNVTEGNAIIDMQATPKETSKSTSDDPISRAMDNVRNGIDSIDNDYDPFSDPDIDEHGEQIPTQTLEQAVASAETVYDNTVEVKDVTDLSDDEWLETLPIWRVLSKMQHRGLRLKKDLIGYREFEEHLKRFKHFVPRCFETPLDTSPFQDVINRVYKLTPPDQWKVHAPCRGGGCRKCDNTGYDIITGVDPLKIEKGE